MKKGGNDSEQALYLRNTPLTVKTNSLERQRVWSDVIVELNNVEGITGRMISETYSISVRELTKEQQVHGIIADGGQLNLEESNCMDHENLIPSNAVCEGKNISVVIAFHHCPYYEVCFFHLMTSFTRSCNYRHC